MAAEADRANFPYISGNVWAELRNKFQSRLPSKVTASYLQSALGFSTEKAARNLLPQLRAVGLIDSEGTPTELAGRFRLDEEYAKAASEILQAVYPVEMRELFPGPEVDLAGLTSWIMRYTGGGQAGAGSQARFYVGLASGATPAKGAARATRSSATPSRSEGRPAPRRSAPSQEPATPRQEEGAGETESRPVTTRTTPGPALHIDLQIHIDSSASVEQIDAVFESMARHLYRDV